MCSVVAIVVLLGGAGYLLTRPKAYQSTSSVALLPASTDSSVLTNYPNIIASLIPTYIQLVSSPALLDQVAATLPFTISETQLANDVHAQSLSSAAVIDIVADSPNAVHAQEIAARTTAVFLAEVSGNGVVITSVYAQPTIPGAPEGPKTKLLLAVILVLAVALGLGAGLAWDRLFGGVDDSPESPEAAAAPILGMITELGEQENFSAVLSSQDTTASNDRWRALRTNFIYATAGRHARSVFVTSFGSGEGKTTVAVNLAVSLADLGLSVVLVDAAVRFPTLHEVFGLDNAQGLTSTVLTDAEPASLLRPIPTVAGLQVITAGPRLSHLEAGLYRQQLPRFSSLADIVIVDGPVLEGDVGAALAAGVADAVVLVARASQADMQVRAGLRVLQRYDAPVVGTVLTAVNGTLNPDEPSEDSGNYQTSKVAGPARP